jgi:hypothetical protein
MADNVQAKRDFNRMQSLMSDLGSKTVVKKLPDFDDQFWRKLLKAGEGLETLNADDARRIVEVLRTDDEELPEAKIVDLIIGRLKDSKDVLDEGFLRYLSENYNQLLVTSETKAVSFVEENNLEDAEDGENDSMDAVCMHDFCIDDKCISIY